MIDCKFKRYPKYKESGIEWIGDVPEGWRVKRLKRVSHINPIKSNSQFNKGLEDLVTFLPMEKVSEDGLIDTSIKKPIKDLWNGFTYFQEHDVIVAKITPCFENGKGALLVNLGSKIGFGSTEFHVLRAKHDGMIKEYLYYITRTDMFRKLGEAFMTGAAGQKRVPNSFIEDFPVCFPCDLSEQRAIIDFINDKTSQIDTLIDKKQKLIELLKEYRTAIINQAVTKGLNPDVPMKDSGIEWLGEVPEHWKVIRLKHLAGNDNSVAQTGPFGAQLHASDYVSEGVPLILIRNVNNLYIDDTDIPKITEEKAKTLEMYRVKVGDIVFSRVGSIGRIALVKDKEKDWLISGQMLRVRLNIPRLDRIFLTYVFSSTLVSEFIKYKSVGSTRDSINTDILRNIPITLPPLKEQNLIVQFIELQLSKIDETVTKTQNQIDLLKEYRTALISDVVTGKIDVRGEI